MPRKIILDVDTGSDDACAIMLAYLHPDIDLQAVCTVKGNQPIQYTTENTLRIRELLNADFPVYKGCSGSLVKNVVYPRIPPTANADAYDEQGNKIHIHQELFDLPESKGDIEELNAPNFYVDYLSKTREKITIVAVGPLTNLAVALIMKPEIAENIEEIVIMGGGWNITNATLAAEFNIYDDPEAAQRVLHCGAKITMVPLDATHSAYISREDAQDLRKINTPASLFAADLIDVRILVHDYAQPLEVPHTCALHDPLCIAYLIDPEVLQDVKLCNVEVSLSGLTEGQTCVDQRAIQENRNVNFAFKGDHERFSKILLEAFRG
ncbi:MAG: nucleoside hydrolase [Erysipelotrichaceae bacterium]|nr:nucleoside hydrolase [Erysipelotrichaceae bacterium]